MIMKDLKLVHIVDELTNKFKKEYNAKKEEINYSELVNKRKELFDEGIECIKNEWD